MARHLLLISNSTLHGSGYLEHCADQIRDFLPPPCRVLFVPYALFDHAAYSAKAKPAFEQMGYTFRSLHECEDPRAAVSDTDAYFVGGGNTFRLLERLYREGLVEPMREAVHSGKTRYMGASAGSNVATASIRTTNDMPIVYPPSFDALGLVPFNINPHYLDPDPNSTHMGETRETRLTEFLEENDKVVVGLREGSMLRVDGDSMQLHGVTGARLFQRDSAPREVDPGTDLSQLLV